MNQITEKSLHSLVELLKAYETQISDVNLVRSKVTYCVKIKVKDSLLTLDTILINVYKILQAFTYPGDPKNKIELKYEVVE